MSFPLVVLNTIMSEAIDEMSTELEGKLAAGTDFETALGEVLSATIKASKTVIFNGDGYSDEWTEEAAERGLLNLRTTMDALPKLHSEKNVALFEKYKVLSDRELESRLEIWLEQYFLNVNIESETTASIANTMVIPAAIRYINDLAAAAERVAALGLDTAGSKGVLTKVNGLLNDLTTKLAALEEANAAEKGESAEDVGLFIKEKVIPAMNDVRAVADDLEKALPDDIWPLPSYREMLFVK